MNTNRHESIARQKQSDKGPSLGHVCSREFTNSPSEFVLIRVHSWLKELGSPVEGAE